MKVKGFFIDEKSYIRRRTYIAFVIFIIGIILGAVYCVTLNAESDNDLNAYLTKYFSSIQANGNQSGILKNSLLGYIKIFVVIYLSSFVRPGIFLTASTVTLKGFTSGFTTASFIKYYGVKGMLIPSASLVSVLLYLPAMLILSASSMSCSVNRYNYEKSRLRSFNVLSICCFTIFCAASFSDAFITTTFMKLIASLFTIN